MPNSIVSSSSSNYNRSHITDLSISIISDKNKPRPQSASSSRRGSLNNNNNSKQLMDDDLHSLRSFQKVPSSNNNRPSSGRPKFKQREAEKENNTHNNHINTSAYKLDDEDNVSEPVSWRDDAVSIRSYNNSPSLNNSKNSQRPQSSFVYSIAKRAPIIPRPGSAPLTKKGKLDTSHRSKTPSELYDESFYEMQRRDESNAAITNPWHQTLDEHHERPLITTVLHDYRDDISTSRCSSRMSDKKDFIEMNKHALAEKARNAKRNSVTARPHSYVLDNSFEGSASEFSTSAHLEGEERRKTHTTLMKKFSTRQSVPRTVNSRTIFNPTTLAYDNTSPLKNRPKSALSKVMYKQTTRHQDVVSVMSDTLRPRSAMSTYSVKETFKRPTSEEPFKRSSSFLNVQGFSINQAKVVHEGHYEMPRRAKRGAPKPDPQPHTIAMCVHNSRFSIENQ